MVRSHSFAFIAHSKFLLSRIRKFQPWVETNVHVAILDASTNACIVDSLEIARYLDAQYPDTPKVLDGLIAGGGSFSNVVELVWMSLGGALENVFGPLMAKTVVRGSVTVNILLLLLLCR